MTRSTPGISVVIPCYNAGRFIRETLQSVYAQSVPDLQVIVVDDGSTDDSVYIIRHEFPQVQLIQTSHSGPSYARQAGTQQVEREFVQYLDADDLLEPGKLLRQKEMLEHHSADVAYGAWQPFLELKGGARQEKAVVDRTLSMDPTADLISSFWCPPAAYLIRRSFIEKTPGWNPSLPVNEDVRFMLDCAFQGARFIKTDGLMARHREYPESTSERDKKYFFSCCVQNAEFVEWHWRNQGPLTQIRKDALNRVYSYLAEITWPQERKNFQTVRAAIQRVDPDFVPIPLRRLGAVAAIVPLAVRLEVFGCYARMRQFVKSAARCS